MSKRNHKHVAGRPTPLSFPEVDVVIPYHGPADLMRKCLDALPGAAGETKINVVVVDDFYEDGTEIQKLVAETPYHVTLVRNPQNVGFGATCNRGTRLGGSRFILFLNADAILLPEAIHLMVTAIKEDPLISVVGPKLLFPEDSQDQGRPAGRIQHAGIEINIRADPFHIYLGWHRYHPKVMQPRIVPAVTGAVFLVRREDFQKVQGFDQLYGKGTFEDVDYCFKMALAGKKALYLPAAEGYHTAGGSHTPYPLQTNSMLFKSRWMGYMRWTDWELW